MMIWTIPASCSFCDVLADYLTEKFSDFSLAQTTLILPSRRAVKSVRDAFMKKAEKKTLLLPKLVSLYDIEGVILDLEPPLDETERTFILMRLIRQKQDMSYAKAFELAQGLARFIDELEIYNVPFEKLKTLTPDEFAQHWQQTLSFLEIIGTFYPEILKEKGKTSPALYRKSLLEKIIETWKENPPDYPIIAAGFNGGLPTVNRFLKGISELPNTEIILPYLDKNLSDEAWEKLDETHPQYMLRGLLKDLEVTPQEIMSLAEDTHPRQRLATEMMTPVSLTHTWQDQKHAFDGIEKIKSFVSATPDEEALSIALILREVLETPNKTAALISPDRNLAKRVIAHMKRWNVLLDDSGGTSLDLTPVGRFFLILAEAAVSQNIQHLLSLLKHPLSACGKSPPLFRKEIQMLEKESRKDTKKNFNPDLPEEVHTFLSLFINPIPVPLEELIKSHIAAAEALAISDDRTAEERLWNKEDGIVLSELLTALLEQATHLPLMDAIEYPAFLKVLMRTKSIRPKYGMHPRLDILGVMESRLQSPDLVIIGGLNEGCFPEKAGDDLWLSRPMRKQLKLPLPEEKIGIAANDFIHAFMAKEVILSRALKEGTTPTIPSRWLLRMETVLKASGQEIPSQKHPLLNVLRPFLSTTPCERPMPCPPLSSRPNRMSVTGIEKWMHDPYGIYASKILGLQKLNDLGEKNNASYGIAVHSVLKDFLVLPPNLRTRKKLDELAQNAFKKNELTQEELTFKRPIFDNAMNWIMNNLPEKKPFVEETAALELSLESGPFKLTGQADRIDITEQGATIIDYKTGEPPKKSHVQQGNAPQLPLEAFLLENGAFKEIGKTKATNMAYIHLSGKGDGAKINSPVDKKMSAEELIKRTYENTVCLINLFRREDTPYAACPLSHIQPTYNDYAHLERLAEWQNSVDGDNADE